MSALEVMGLIVWYLFCAAFSLVATGHIWKYFRATFSKDDQALFKRPLIIINVALVITIFFGFGPLLEAFSWLGAIVAFPCQCVFFIWSLSHCVVYSVPNFYIGLIMAWSTALWAAHTFVYIFKWFFSSDLTHIDDIIPMWPMPFNRMKWISFLFATAAFILWCLRALSLEAQLAMQREANKNAPSQEDKRKADVELLLKAYDLFKTKFSR